MQKYLVTSLSTLVLAGAAAAPLSAASIKDETNDMSLSVKGQLQTRLSLFPDAQGATGANYDPIRGSAGDPEEARFELRRGRLFIDSTFGNGWTGSVFFNFDNAEANGYGTTNGGTTRSVNLYKATVGKAIKTGPVTHEIIGGYEEPYCYDYSMASSSYVTPYGNAAATLTAYIRGMGAFYNLHGDFFRVSASLMNNTNAAATPTTSGDSTGNDAKKGNFASIRAEMSPGKDMWIAKRQQTYGGALSGTHVVVGYDLMQEWGKQVADGAEWADQTVLIHGPDVQVHWDGLTANLAYKLRNISWDRMSNAANVNDSYPDLHQDALVVEVAYAMPMNGTMIEPAVRFTQADMNRHSTAAESYGRGYDYSTVYTVPAPGGSTLGSGRQLEVGVNWYLKGHANKLQLAYVNWDAANGPGRADTVVLQHQLLF